jgi:hypothetical protein
MTFAKSVSKSRTSSWSNTVGLKVSVSATGGAKVPLLAEGKVTVTVEGSEQYNWGGSNTTTDTITITLPINVPPNKKYRAYARVQQGDVTLPYTMIGTLHFKSGATVHRTVSGVYTGNNSYIAEAGAEDITDGKASLAHFVLQGGVAREVPAQSQPQ